MSKKQGGKNKRKIWEDIDEQEAWRHYKEKGCFKYSPRDKIWSNELFRRFSIRNTCLFSKILLERHEFLTKNLLNGSLPKILSLGLYLKHPFLL